MAFDPNIPAVTQAATNFFASAYPIAVIIIGTMLGALVLRELFGFFRRRQ